MLSKKEVEKLNVIRAKFLSRQKVRADADDSGWRTTENGHKIHINDKGEVDKGNPNVLRAIEENGGSVAKTANRTKSLSKKSTDALKWYASGEGMWINQYLRGRMNGEKLSASEKETLKALDDATTNDIPKQTLYRAVSADAIFGAMSDFDFSDLWNHLKYGNYGKGEAEQNKKRKFEEKIKSTVGKEITEKGFMSTTKDRELANDWDGFTGSTRDIVLELNVPDGTKGIDLSESPEIKEYETSEGIESQKEVLLARNQKYVVKDVLAKDGKIYVKADIV